MSALSQMILISFAKDTLVAKNVLIKFFVISADLAFVLMILIFLNNMLYTSSTLQESFFLPPRMINF